MPNDFFASTPLLRATGWWDQAGVVVLDEFDPTSLLNLVPLDASDLAAMGRLHRDAPAIQTMLRWVAQTIATTTDRTLGGVLFLDELERQARQAGADLDVTLPVALAELPPADQLNMRIGLPTGASLADYRALPPGHTATLLTQIATERRRQRERAVQARLCAATQQLLDRGTRVIDVAMLAAAAQVSVVATRKHWRHVAARLRLAMHTRRRMATMPRGGARSVPRMVLIRRGRVVPPQAPSQPPDADAELDNAASEPLDGTPAMSDHARDRSSATRLIHHRQRRIKPTRQRRRWGGSTRRWRVWGMRVSNNPSTPPRARPAADERPHGPAP